MLLYWIVLIVVSYVVFVFISDLMNPFIPIRAPLRKRRWRLGRAAAVSSLVGGSIALFLFAIQTLDERTAVGFYLLLAAVFMIPAVIKYKKSALWQ